MLDYVNNAIKPKLLKSKVLAQKARNSTKKQFAKSTDLAAEIVDAVIDTLATYAVMSRQAQQSKQIRKELKNVLLGPAQLYEQLRITDSGAPE